jgi:CheY-like chemotaxis protein
LARTLEDLRILVVEDEALVALDIERMLRALGCRVVGPAARVCDALRLIDGEGLDGALLDVNLGRETIFPVADALALRGIPHIFSTGYDAAIMPERFRGIPRLGKPFGTGELSAVMTRVFLAS